MVDFPAPSGPRNPATFPGETVNDRWPTASLPPQRFLRSRASIMVTPRHEWENSCLYARDEGSAATSVVTPESAVRPAPPHLSRALHTATGQ